MAKGSQTQRWFKIALRTGHLVGICGVAGGILLTQPWHTLTLYWALAIATGAGMIAQDALKNWLWLVQIRGVVIIAKLLLLLALGHNAHADQWLIVGVILLSGVVAHAPGNVRYFSLLHGRRMDSPRDVKG